MNTSFLAKVDPLNNEAAYVGVVALSLVLSVFGGMTLIWPGDELNTTVGQKEPAPRAPGGHQPPSPSAATAVDLTAPSAMAVEARAVTTESFPDKRP